MDVEETKEFRNFFDYYTILSESDCFIGGTSIVKKVIFKKTNVEYAAKMIDKGKVEYSYICNEIQILQRLNHPYIIKIIDTFIVDNIVIIILDWMSGGNVSKYNLSFMIE